MNSNTRLVNELSGHELYESDLEARFDDFLDDTNDEIYIMGVTMSPHRFLKDNDSTAYRCAFSDWLDSEIECENLKEYGGGTYTQSNFIEAIEEAVRAVETSLDGVRDEITAAQEKLSEIDNEDGEARGPIDEEIEALTACEEELQTELNDLENLK